MAGELKRIYGSWVTLQSSGASIANNALSAAAATSLDLTGSFGGVTGYPHVEFACRVTFGTNPTVNTAVELLRRQLAVDGTNDGLAPSTTWRPTITAFPVEASTSAQWFAFDWFFADKKCNLYLYNNATGQTISSWDLSARSFTIQPA